MLKRARLFLSVLLTSALMFPVFAFTAPAPVAAEGSSCAQEQASVHYTWQSYYFHWWFILLTASTVDSGTISVLADVCTGNPPTLAAQTYILPSVSGSSLSPGVTDHQVLKTDTNGIPAGSLDVSYNVSMTTHTLSCAISTITGEVYLHLYLRTDGVPVAVVQETNNCSGGGGDGGMIYNFSSLTVGPVGN
jgi:hypothetical protein